MAASPSRQTHWLKLRVDLGLEQHSGTDPGAGAGSASCPSPPFFLVMRCRGHGMSAQQTDEGGEGVRVVVVVGEGGGMHFSLWL